MKSGDLARVAAEYEIFAPAKLLFTRLDETGSFGSILNEAVRSERPLSFFGTGQRIPEDLEPAASRRVADLVLGGARNEREPAERTAA